MLEFDQFEGKEIAGRFLLGPLLGKGGYGAVFEAEQVSMKRRCAVKLLHQQLLEDRNIVERFRAEAIATSKLSHPNTVVIYDFGVDEASGLLFLAMEFLEGVSLNEVISRQGPLPVDVVLHLVDQIAASLGDAHQRGIIHRDIKPHNIMVVPRPNDPYAVKVIDFGIAKILEETTLSTMDKLTRTGVMVGTPHYMAPEQIRDEEVDGRTDLYALGMCVYKMLTGRVPFSGGTAVDVACRQLTDVPGSLRSYAPALPVNEAFEQALLQAVSKEKQTRYASATVFARALRQSARALSGPLSLHDSLPPGGLLESEGATVATSVTATAPMDMDLIAHDHPTLDRPHEAFAPTLDDTPRPTAAQLNTPLPLKAGQKGHLNRSTMLLFPSVTADQIQADLARMAAMKAQEDHALNSSPPVAPPPPLPSLLPPPPAEIKVRTPEPGPAAHAPRVPLFEDAPAAQLPPPLPGTVERTQSLFEPGEGDEAPVGGAESSELWRASGATAPPSSKSLLPVLVGALLLVALLLGLLAYGVATRQ